MNKKNNTEESSLKITPIKQSKITLTVRGTTPLIVHAWSQKALTMIRLTAAERKKVKKEARDPQAEAMAAAYYTDDEQFGIPAMGIKSAIISAAHKDLGIEKTLVRKALFLLCEDSGMVLPIKSDPPIIREDIVRVGMSQTDLRYRPEFRNWRCEIPLLIDAELLNPQDVVNLIDRAGFSVGIGEMRPEKGGEFGRFEVDQTVAIQAKEAA